MAERGEDDPEETDGIGESHVFEALVQGWGEKCCLLKLGVPTGAGPCRKTLVPGMPEKLVRGAAADGELPDGGGLSHGHYVFVDRFIINKPDFKTSTV